MGVIRELFTTSIGLASFVVIVLTLVVGFYIKRWVQQRIEEDEARQRALAHKS